MSRSNKMSRCINGALSRITRFVMQIVYINYFVTSTIYYSIINLIYNRITLDCDVYQRERFHKTETSLYQSEHKYEEEEDDDSDLISSIILELNQMSIQSNHDIRENNYDENRVTNVDTVDATTVDLYEIVDNLFEYIKGVFHWSTHSQSFIARHIRVICGLYMFATVFCILYDFANHYEQLFYKITQSQ